MPTPGKNAKPVLTLSRREALWAYAFLLLPLAFFLLVRLWPTLQAFQLSLFTWHVDPLQRQFVGLGHYQEMLGEPRLQRALLNTWLYTIIIVPAQLVLGLSIAILLQSVTAFKGLFRAIYFAPYVTPAVAVAWVWSWLYSVNFGVFNNLLIEWSLFWEGLGITWLSIAPQPFLASPSQALVAVAVVVIWQGLGFQVVIFLAGLQGIPRMYYEAARIDGANPWHLFRHITVPLLNPVIVFSVVISTITSLQLFDQVVNIRFLDQGGPLNSTLTIVLYLYQEAFGRFRFGYATAVAVLLFILILMVTIVQLKLISRRVDY
ncbi:MAG: sugar ABC transporter permease [Truepera sp.]|nr:sugar ABC transporter permease [Truepera sp.]